MHWCQILFQIGETFTETFQMLQQAYGEDCLSPTQCHKWYQHLKLGRTSIEDNPKFGWPSMSMDNDHIEKMLAVIHQNRHLTVCEVAEEVGICKKFVPPDFDRQTEDVSCCRKICAASADRCTKKGTMSQSVRSCLIVRMLMKTF